MPRGASAVDTELAGLTYRPPGCCAVPRRSRRARWTSPTVPAAARNVSMTVRQFGWEITEASAPGRWHAPSAGSGHRDGGNW